MREENILGRKFARLFVIERVEKSYGMWVCKCECGTVIKTTAYQLKHNKTKSCGCYRRDAKKREYGEAAKKAVLTAYKKNARERKVNFLLTEEQFYSLTKSACNYCGASPSNVRKSKPKNGDYIYNGIDRIDNDLNYTVENTVPCCELCNRMKSKLQKTNFLDQITKIYEHTKRKEAKIDTYSKISANRLSS